MKKYIFGLAALAMLVTSCDPIKTEVEPNDGISTDNFKVVVTPRSENNNNFTVVTEPNRYFNLYTSLDGQTWENQGSGLKVAVQTAPPAGSISFYAETMLSTGEIVKSPVVGPISFTEFTDLPELYKDLFNYNASTGDYNPATYGWKQGVPFVWGAGSYLDPGQTIKTGPWWGVSLAEIDPSEQDATMELSLAGITTSLGTSGSLKVTIDPIATDVNGGTWNVGNLKLGTPVIRGYGGWGEGDFLEYQVIDASNGELFLAHPDDGFTGGPWSTCWYWYFEKQ